MNVKENRVFVILDLNALDKNMETNPPKMTEGLDFHIILYHTVIYSCILCVYCVLLICVCVCMCVCGGIYFH